MNLDAGYVSILPVDYLGLHGRKLFCVIFVTLILFSISLLNLTVKILIYLTFALIEYLVSCLGHV